VAAEKVDYYVLLGVPPDADREAIREAFRGAAPAGDQADVRELAEAYSVLARPASRLLYDRFGFRGRGNTGFDEALWDALEGANEAIEVPVTLRERDALRGFSRLVKYEAEQTCHACEGRGTSGAVDPGCPSCGGTGRRSHVSGEAHTRFLHVEACPMCGGEVCSGCGGSGREPAQRSVRVRFPAGIENGTLLRVDGEGDVGERGGAPGDLLLDVTVLPESQDSRLVRYTALALCLAAIALLVAYVLFQ